MLDADTSVATHITAHAPGYIDKDLETIVGLQTDKPLKRAMFPYGGLRTAKSAIEEYGFKMDPQTEDFFKKHRKTHMMAYLMYILQKCVLHVQLIL